jgi:hypothetical protein
MITPPRFWPAAIAFLITRAGDMWSTHLFMSQPGGEAGEMNPLSSILGFTFWPLLASNVLVSAALLYGHWWYCRNYAVRSIQGSPKDRWQFLSLVFYGRPDHARHLFLRSGKAPALYHAQLAHVLLQTVAVVSVLAVLHNLGQFHSWAINDTLREVLVRPAFFIYGIGAITAVGFYLRMAEREFETWRYSQFGGS